MEQWWTHSCTGRPAEIQRWCQARSEKPEIPVVSAQVCHGAR